METGTVSTVGVAARAGQVRLELGRLRDVKVSMVAAPYLSVLSIMKEVLGNNPRGLPLALSRLVDRSSAASSHAAATPFADPARTMVPNCLTPATAVSARLKDPVDTLRDTPGDTIIGAIAEEYGNDPAPSWWPALQAPTQWLNAFADATLDVAHVIEPVWTRTRLARRQEADRLATAQRRDALDVYLGSLSERLAFHGTVLSFADPQAEDVALRRRPLVLVPMLAGPRILFTSFESDRVIVGFPVRLPSEFNGLGTDAALVQLLGQVRADALLALGRGRTAGELSQALQLAPPTVTFHCNRLAACGLITRRRRGQHTLITRTRRGTELLDLMGS